MPDDSEYESLEDVEKWNQEVTEEDYKAMLKEHKGTLKKKRQVSYNSQIHT